MAPTPTKVRRTSTGSEIVELTQAEIDQKEADKVVYLAKTSDYRYKRQLRYETEIDPFMKEAVADQLLEADLTKMDVLAAVRAQIKLDIPKVT